MAEKLPGRETMVFSVVIKHPELTDLPYKSSSKSYFHCFRNVNFKKYCIDNFFIQISSCEIAGAEYIVSLNANINSTYYLQFSVSNYTRIFL